LPVGASFDGETFSWTPDRGTQGSYLVRFTATDEIGLTASVIITITVDPFVPSYLLALGLLEDVDFLTSSLAPDPLRSQLKRRLRQLQNKLDDQEGAEALVQAATYLAMLDRALASGEITEEIYNELVEAMDDVTAVVVAMAFPNACYE
jgi:hypothetical protein